MPSILDAFPYPFFRPEAQQLHETLTQLHPTPQAAMLLAERAGLRTYLIDFQQASLYVWKQILETAANSGHTRALVQQAHDLLHPSSPARPFLEDLLAGRPTPVSGEPRTPDGAPRFVEYDDAVTEPEALLFHDDLTVGIGRVPALIATMQRLVSLAPAVCKLTVDVNGTGQYGTAFRVGPDLLLTNWHVVHRGGARAGVVTAEFDFEDDGEGGIRDTTVIPCDVTTIVGNQEDDWAVVRVARPLSEAWLALRLADAAVPVEGGSAYVIQHPRGDRKRVGLVRNQVSYVDDRVVHYLTDTQVGSSGAPVFDTQGRLIALHHAGGRPQDLLGRPPLRKNEGIRISRILANDQLPPELRG